MSHNNALLNPPVLSQSPYHPNRPPSPATTAAAMSLGALAAAASIAAPTPTHSLPHPPPPPPPPPLPHYYQNFIPSQSQQQQQQQQQPKQHLHHPEPIAPQPQPHSSYPLHNHPIVPAMSQIARPKPTPTPVAPAPTNMHPSQQQSHPNGKPKQKRYRATPEQLRHLLAQFESNPSPSSSELQELAINIRMPPQSAVLWFKNRRARVPHKKSDKPIVVKSNKPVDHPKFHPNTSPSKRDDKPTEKNVAKAIVDAANSMADIANSQRSAGTNITNETRLEIPLRSPSRSPPPLYRNRAADAIPFDIGLASRLAGNAKRGAEFSTPTTMRRPRVVPPTPRLFSQKAYQPGDMVEVLETSKGICRSWYSATIVDSSGLNELSLGVSAATVCGNLPKLSGLPSTEATENAEEQDADGGDSPRTVRSPAASPTPSIAKVTYVVEYCHRFEQGNSDAKLKEEVLASRIRPAPPYSESLEDWRPDQGEAVEVLRDGAWFVAVIQAFAVRKGYMVSFESGDVQWVRRHGLRPYRIWRGGDSWVTKTKPPLPVVRKSVGLSVTHPPGGKRKRRSLESGKATGTGSNCEARETRARSKRAKTVLIDESGPDGLPEGWRRSVSDNYGKRMGAGVGTKGQTVYIAPDGNRLRSLKEAQRYVKLMGPG